MSIHEKLKIQTYLAIAIVVAAITHVLIGVYFAYIGLYLVVFLNMIDVLAYLIGFFINKAGKTRIASFIIVFKIVLYSAMSTFLFGIHVNAHWFILIAILPVALYLDFTKIQKFFIIGLMPMLINLQLMLPLIHPPLINMDDNMFLSLFFANIIVISFIFEISLHAVISKRVSDLQAKEMRDIKHISNVDPLTELSNRRYAENFFEKLDSVDTPFLFCLMDIDDFKSINDTYGHGVGDIVLIAVSNILRKNTRKGDLVCRWGGEEFLVGLPKCNLESGKTILEKIRKSIASETMIIPQGELRVTITGGAKILIDNDVKKVLAECDKNLYEGKRVGKNKIVFNM